jgi:hypothetical protein
VSIKTSVNVVGLPELDKALRELRAEMGGAEGNIVASALRAAGKDTVLKSMKEKAAAHRKTGRLYDNLTIKKHPNPKHWSEIYGIGVHRTGSRPQKGEPDSGDLPWYASIVEYGGRGKYGPLKGFMRKSLDDNKSAFLAHVKANLGKKIESAAKKIGNKNLQAVGAAAKSAVSTSRGRLSHSGGSSSYTVTGWLPKGGG